MQAHAEARSESVNGFINRAITRDYGTGQRRSCGFWGARRRVTSQPSHRRKFSSDFSLVGDCPKLGCPPLVYLIAHSTA